MATVVSILTPSANASQNPALVPCTAPGVAGKFVAMVAPETNTEPPGVTAMFWPRLLSEPPMQVEDKNDWPLGLISVRKAVVAEKMPAEAVPPGPVRGAAKAT